MALPSSRNTTYAPGSQVKSADLNDLQDMIVGRKHGEIWRWVPITSPPQGWSHMGSEDHYLKPDGSTVLRVMLPLTVGDRLLEAAAIVYDALSSESLWFRLVRVTVTIGGDLSLVSVEQIGSVLSSTSTLIQKLSITPANPPVVSQTSYLIASITPSSPVTDLRLYGILMRYDRL